MQKLPIGLLASGLAVLITTIIFGYLYVPNKVHEKIVNAVQLENGSETWKKWSNISTPIFIDFYIFNVTNTEDVTRGERPHLQELGPYVYEQKRQKFDISVNERQDTIKYRQRVTYFYRQDLSVGSNTDEIFVLNLPLVGISKRLAKMPGIVSFMANMYMERFDQHVFLKTNVNEFLFKGKYQPLVDALQNTFSLKILPNSTFGLYYGKNNTDDGLYEIQSGRRNVSEFGKILKWKGQSKLSWWAGESCNRIIGTDGSIFPPFVEKDRILWIFTPDLCRSIYMTFNRELDFMGIPAFKFTIPPEMLGNPRVNTENMCFCPNPGRNLEGCPQTGAIQLAACRKGAPIVASTPHFIDGFEGYIEQSVGLYPIRSKHETFIKLEPNSGALLQVSKRIQINVELEPISTLDIFRRVPEMLFPVIWIKERSSMSSESIELLKKKLIKPLSILHILRISLVVISVLCIIIGIFVFVIRAVRAQRKAHRKDNSQS